MAKKTIPKKIKGAVEDYIKYLQTNGLGIQKAFIFGSFAKGKSRKWSDVDVCVVSDDFKGKIDPLTYLWIKKRNKDTKAMISPVGFHPKDFIDEDPLVWEIKKSGIKIPV